ncbi:aspartyl-phosphate phosphatase Spo0E family protein [Texcoconibacillus texcoconensis]|uniref:Stage 0 sporulation regulatory protein n=1 Tax=Texcoconibacillus texcoconensis TaxID=1095777 RepID=A0A840QPR6_9BACI|nr:aspartyl-phosphate phosphatase Spo0E family protein [Texcoconibacillus texcoconensis]MBB5173313.1 stage 0 sporulation regulatory protein [Texcoconibacillus texcoconensis]
MSVQELLIGYIEIKRWQMVRSAQENGFTSSETIQYSQELDELLNVHRGLIETQSVKHASE